MFVVVAVVTVQSALMPWYRRSQDGWRNRIKKISFLQYLFSIFVFVNLFTLVCYHGYFKINKHGKIREKMASKFMVCVFL